MKKIFFALTALAVVVSCNKVDMNMVSSNGDFSEQELITFDFGGLETNGDVVSTKIVYAVTGKTHTFSWEEGDEISMLMYKQPDGKGVPASTNVVNFSRNSFMTSTSGSTASFTGMIPLDDVRATLGNSGTCLMFPLFPATELVVEESSSGEYYKLSGASIPSVQDGTGLKYCFFTIKPTWSSSGASATAEFQLGAATLNEKIKYNFVLSNALIKFSIKAEKPIKKIGISSLNSYLAGDIVYHTGSIGIQSGCVEKSLTIENGDILPSEIYFACRLLNNHKGDRVAGSENITFTFTADDGTKTAKILCPKVQYTPMAIWNLGEVDLTSATWE